MNPIELEPETRRLLDCIRTEVFNIGEPIAP